MSQIRYVAALLRLNLKSQMMQPRRYFWLASAMFLQNCVFFALWPILMAKVQHINGWDLSDMFKIFGVGAFAIGLNNLVADGSGAIAQRVLDGDLDTYLTRPRHVLPQLALTQSNPSGLGDMLWGLMILGLSGLSLDQWPGALLVGVCAAFIFQASVIAFQSLIFFLDVGGYFADQLEMVLLCLATTPQHTQSLGMKVLMFSAVPAGFLALLPVEILRGHWEWLPVMVLAASGYMALAVWVFYIGLRRYTSAAGFMARAG